MLARFAVVKAERLVFSSGYDKLSLVVEAETGDLLRTLIRGTLCWRCGSRIIHRIFENLGWLEFGLHSCQ